MQWFKHSKDFRNSTEIKFIENSLGEAGYARAVKLFELIAHVAGRKKPFQPRILLEPPYTWQMFAMEIGCMAESEFYGKVPDMKEAVRTIRLFAECGLVSIEQEAEFIVRRDNGPRGDEVATWPHQIYVPKMTDWCDWHDLSNRNRKKNAESTAEGSGKPRFGGMKTPG